MLIATDILPGIRQNCHLELTRVQPCPDLNQLWAHEVVDMGFLKVISSS